jgi:predicted nucleotidyltransferase
MIADILPEEILAIERTASATMLFGSYARGDQGAESDIDLLQIVNKPEPARKIGRIVVSCYTLGQLTTLAKQGSLFVLHLRTEGRILNDEKHILRSALESYVRPPSYGKLLTAISTAAAVLHLKPDSLNANQASGILSLGLYLLRTLVYVRCIEKGTPAFSLVRAREILGDSEGIALLAERRGLFKNPRVVDLNNLRDHLEDLLGKRVEFLGSELEVVAVNATGKNKEAGKLITRILLGDATIHYELLVGDDL